MVALQGLQFILIVIPHLGFHCQQDKDVWLKKPFQVVIILRLYRTFSTYTLTLVAASYLRYNSFINIRKFYNHYYWILYSTYNSIKYNTILIFSLKRWYCTVLMISTNDQIAKFRLQVISSLRTRSLPKVCL